VYNKMNRVSVVSWPFIFVAVPAEKKRRRRNDRVECC
jgi:hypothetical protein